MRIVSVDIVSFGKLKGVKLQLDGGLNVIKRDNGFGKTTFASFVRAMLYGFSYTRVKGVTDVSHYAPWDSAESFGGSMTVEHEGETYRIERFFGDTARKETCTVFNEKTGKIVNWGVEIGEYLLGLTADSYDRSVYYPQESVELNSNDNLEARLANLVQDGAENYDKVQDKLRVYKKNLRHERGNGGKIYELECRKQELSRELIAAHQAEHRSVAIDEHMQQIEQEKAALISQQAACSERLTRLQQELAAPPVKEVEHKQTKGNSNLLLYLGSVFALLGIVFIALGIANALGVVAYVVGAIALAVGVGCVVVRFVLARQNQQHAQVDNSESFVDGRAQEVQSCVSTLNSIAERLAELAGEAGRLSQERQNLTFDAAAVQDKILEVIDEQNDAVWRFNVADNVVKLLEKAKDNLSRSYLPRLCARCSELLQKITQADMAVTVDRNFELSVRENWRTKPMSEFSRGIREIILLCFRVALSELLYDGSMPLLIIDDAFVNFDEQNFVRATELLRSLAQQAQVVYLTCHSRTGSLLK